ncbi:MAG: hypothetical protein V1891_00235 [bacterium]
MNSPHFLKDGLAEKLKIFVNLNNIYKKNIRKRIAKILLRMSPNRKSIKNNIAILFKIS